MTPKLLISILLTGLFTQILFSQITFEKTYSQPGEGTSIEQIVDGNSINQAADSCTTQLEGYTYIGATATKQYFVSNTKSTRYDLNNNTLPEHASLAFVKDLGELYVILNGIDEMVYIGMNDVATEGELVWENGKRVNYTNFDICDFCEGNSDDKDYVIMNHWNGGWSYSSQYEARKHVIELPCTTFYDLLIQLSNKK